MAWVYLNKCSWFLEMETYGVLHRDNLSQVLFLTLVYWSSEWFIDLCQKLVCVSDQSGRRKVQAELESCFCDSLRRIYHPTNLSPWQFLDTNLLVSLSLGLETEPGYFLNILLLLALSPDKKRIIISQPYYKTNKPVLLKQKQLNEISWSKLLENSCCWMRFVAQMDLCLSKSVLTGVFCISKSYKELSE